MFVIGLTGPSGAGKGEVARLFAAYGLPIINADQVYHDLLLPPSSCLDELTECFGRAILSPDGTLDRRALSGIVFSNPASLQQLNSITHRYVMEKTKALLTQFAAKGTRAVVFDAPQLFEAGAHRICNTVVTVLADRSLRIERIMQRDGIDAESAIRRIDSQKSDDYFRKHSEYIIENNTSIEDLFPAVRRILTETGVLTS